MAILSLNKILANKVQSYLGGSEAVLIKTVMDLSAEAAASPNGDRVTIPRMAALTVKNITPGTKSVGDARDTLGDVLLLDQSKEVSDYFGYIDEANSTVDRQAQFFKDAPRHYVQSMELLIAAQLETAGPNDFASTAAAVAGSINFNIKDIALAKKKLDQQKVPKTDRWLAVNAEHMEILSSTQEFEDGSRSLSAQALTEGVVSMVKGFKVIQTEDVSKINAYHREAVAFANHRAMTSGSKNIEEEAQVFCYVRGKYGCKLLDGGKRKVTITPTAASGA